MTCGKGINLDDQGSPVIGARPYLYMELHEKAFHIFPWLKKNHYHSYTFGLVFGRHENMSI
jgi:hypothetical protein